MEVNEVKYTLEKLIGHLVLLEEHIQNWDCKDCLIKHKSAITVYFDELYNFIKEETVENLREQFKLLDTKDSDGVRDIRKELIKIYIQQEFK